MRYGTLLPALLLASGLAGCQATSMGRLPPQVVELYDAASPAGWMEIEAERDGRIIELEAEIPVADLPESVRAAADRELPGGTIIGAEREFVAGRDGYEVKKRKGGREYELVFSLEGELLEKEIGLSRSDAPAAVLDAASRAIPGGTFRSVERIERGEETLYHVKFSRNGASYKVELSPEGEVRRKVREAKAEIEIPLAD